MSLSVSTTLISCQSDSDQFLSSSQLAFSRSLQEFCEESVSCSAILGLAIGRTLGILAKSQSFHLFSSFFGTRTTHFGSAAIGFAFEGASFHSISTWGATGSLELGDWNTNLHSALTLALCHGIGKRFSAAGIPIQHLMQNGGMVTLDLSLEYFHIVERSNQGVIERFCNAEIMSLRMEISAKFLTTVCPQLSYVQAKMEINCRANEVILKSGENNGTSSSIEFGEVLSPLLSDAMGGNLHNSVHWTEGRKVEEIHSSPSFSVTTSESSIRKVKRTKTAAPDVSIDQVIAAKLIRLKSFYKICFPREVTEQLLAGVVQLHGWVQEHRVNFENSLSRATAVRRIWSLEPVWKQELLACFYRYRDHSPDHFGFVLETARLAQCISREEMTQHGFTEHQKKKVELGSERCKRESFNQLVQVYQVAAEPLAFAYHNTLFPELPIEELPFYTPVFFDVNEADKIQGYLDHRTTDKKIKPTLGLRLFFKRGALGDSLVGFVKKYGIDENSYVEIENNRRYPPYEHLQKLCEILKIDFDESLRLILQTYFPDLCESLRETLDETHTELVDPEFGYKRFKEEPLYLQHGSKETEKILDYAKDPGSFGEEIYWRRKRLGLTLEKLVELSKKRITIDRILALEANQDPPSLQEMEILSEILNLEYFFLEGKKETTKFVAPYRSLAERIRGEDREIDWSLLQQRPRTSNLARLAQDVEMDIESLVIFLNRKFSPFEVGGNIIYISPEVEASLAFLIKVGSLTWGEIFLLGRRDLSRNWDLKQASSELHINEDNLRKIERNILQPTNQQIEKCAVVYEIDPELVEAMKRGEELPSAITYAKKSYFEVYDQLKKTLSYDDDFSDMINRMRRVMRIIPSLSVDRNIIFKKINESIEPLSIDEILFLRYCYKKLSVRRVYEAFYWDSLVRFLGEEGDEINYRFPDGIHTWRDLNEERLRTILFRAAQARDGSLENAYQRTELPWLKDYNALTDSLRHPWEEDQIVKAEKELGVNSRLLYFYSHRRDLETIEAMEPGRVNF